MSPMAPVDKTTQNNPSKGAVEKADKKPRGPQDNNAPKESFANYLKGVRSEWGKVSWPTWPQIWGQTIVVLVMTSIMSLGLYVLDNTFHFVISNMPGKKPTVENSRTLGR